MRCSFRCSTRICDGWLELVLLGVCAILLTLQVLAPPFIGLANNGDFPKVTGRLSLGPRDRADFVYFVPDYVRASRFRWKSPVLSTELPLAWLAARLAGATEEGAAFDIRWLGAIHALLLLGALYVLLRSLRALPRWRRLSIAAAAIFFFTDVEYVAYCNSFYSDAAALAALLLMTAFAVHIAISGIRYGNTIPFCLAALLFIGSKTQHAMWGFLPAAFLVALSGRRRGLLPAAVLLAAIAIAFFVSPPDYTAQPLFTVVFTKLAAGRPEVLAELGLPAEDAAYIGLNAFSPGAPSNDPKWLAEFTSRSSYPAVLRWYLRHPRRTLGFLEETLLVDALQMRPFNLSNFRREDGRPPGARTRRFALWSDFRSALLRVWPYHLVIWYLLAIGGSARIAYLRRTPVEARLGWIALGIALLASGEFAVASLADAAETYRHLFLFHACTDITVCFAIAAIVNSKPRPAPATALR